MSRTYFPTQEERLQKRMAARLRKLGLKLTTQKGGYAILAYNEIANAWVEAEGMTPVPYSLTMEDVIQLTHEYVAEAEIEELSKEAV